MKKLLEELSIEIIDLQKKLEKAEKDNNKEQQKYILEKTKAILKIAAAGLAVPVAGTAITTLAGWNPVKLNEEKQCAYIVINIDKDGNIKGDKIYRGDFEFKEEKKEVYYYTEWKQKDNGYERNKYTYRAKEDNIKTVLEMIKSENKITNDDIKEKFIRINTETEYSNNLTEEEINAPSYVEALFEERKAEDKIVAQETARSHNSKLMVKIVMELLLILTTNTYISNYTDYFKKIEETLEKKKPESKDLNEIKEKIKRKQLALEKFKKNEEKQG